MELTKRQTVFGCFVVRSAKNASRTSSSTPSSLTPSSSSAIFRYEENSLVPRRSPKTSQPAVIVGQNSIPSQGAGGRHRPNNYNINNSNDMNIQFAGDDLCSGFEPQNWRKDRCRKCFRLKEQHGAAQPPSSSTPKFTPGKIKRFDRPSNGVQNTTIEATTSTKEETKPVVVTTPSVSSWRQRVYGNHPPLKKAQSDVSSNSSQSSSTTSDVSPGDKKDREPSPTPVPPQRKGKLIILKAETFIDDNEPEEISLKPSVSTDSLLSSPPLPKTVRSASPAGQSFKSDASSSAAEYHTANSENFDPMSRTVSYESVASTLMDDRSMVTAESGHSERSATPTESLDETRAFVRSIRAQLEIMENKCARLEEENSKLRRSSPMSFKGSSEGEIINNLKEKLTNAESLCQDYRDENTVLKCELRDLQESVSKHLDPEKKTIKDKLTAAEQLCEELMDENESYKKEISNLQHEIDEMHDQYREEEIDEFRDLQRELEQTAKNCRILQFKLRKSERRNDQTEADRQHLEEKLKELLAHSGGFDPSETPRLRELESELRIAKEVSVRLHNELETLEEKRCKLEDENFYFREKIREMEAREKLEHGRSKYEQKKSASYSRGHSNISKDTNVMYNGNEYNVAQLLRDLQDACERETDLRDQLKFAENDIHAARKSLSDLETENEGLMRQLAKFTTNATGAKNKPMMKRSYSEGHAQIELELAEHEAHTLKSKLDKMEKENECMISRISLLEREAKKSGARTEFSDDELRSAVPDTYYKQKIKILEEEIDEWRLKFETMQKTEADQEIARKTGKVVRSRYIDQQQHDSSNNKDIDLKRKLEIVEQEANVLRQRISNLEAENERLTGENKRITFSSKKSNKSPTNETSSSSIETDSTKMKEKMEQMEKDIYRFINRIAELEKEKETLSKEVERRKKLESIKKETVVSSIVTKFNPQTATLTELRDRVQELSKENATIASSLKTEQQKTNELESQLGDYKQVISMSENQKLITMASKVEVLTNQLKEAQNRFENMHRKFAGLPVGSVTSTKYEDALKERIELLEKSLSEEKAKIKSNQTISKDLLKVTATPEPEDEINSVEITQCNQVLATVEDQVDRIYKQVEQLEAQQKVSPKSSPRPASFKLSPRASEPEMEKEGLLKDIATMKSELQSLKIKLKDRQSSKLDASSSSSAILQEDLPANVSIKLLQKKCQQQEKVIGELKEQLEVSKQERVSAYHECETATARLLQTEDRWNKELEKLKESYENQVKDLKYYLQEAERVKEEKSTSLQERTTLLQEKNKRLTEIETRAQKLENDLKTKHRDLQDKMEAEKKKAKEFETKYQKLETLYENDRQKLNNEKEKFKTDLSDMKKKYDETQNDFEKLKISYEKKEQIWIKDKAEMETKLKSLQDNVKEIEKQAAKKAAETSSAENQKLLHNLDQLKKKMESEGDEWKKEKDQILHDLERKTKEAEFRIEEAERMKKELELLKSRVFDQKQQLEETRKIRDESREELSRWQQTWARERSELAHKLRQEEKVQQAEHQALQLKYESRIKVMEDSSKRFQTQLTQTRRERDQYRESLASAEKKIAEARQKYENDEKDLRQRLISLEKQSEKLGDYEMQLEKEKLESRTLRKNSDTDRRLWNIEKEQFVNRINELERAGISLRSGKQMSTSQSSSALEKDDKDKLIEQSMQLANQLRQQIDEMKVSYDDEVNNLKKQGDKSRTEWNKEKSDMQRKMKDLQENFKVLEIDRRNMLSTKDQNELDKGQLQSERDTLMEKLHDSEIHQLANKYKLDKVADQLTDLNAKVRFGDLSSSEKRDLQDIVKKALEQLMAVREDMGKTKELGKALEKIEGPDDSVSVKSWKSGGDVSRKASASDLDNTDGDSLEGILAKERLGPVGSEAETLSTQSAPNFTKSDNLPVPASAGPPVFMTGKPYIATKSVSVSSEIGFEARIAEFRLRSPSPSPRKITNYPDPPPSIIFNVKHAVQYDSEGRRHWTRRSQIKRSTSLDPNPANLAIAENSDVEDTQSTKSYLRSASTGVDRLDDTPSLADSEPKTEKSSITSQSPSTKRRVIELFATLRRTSKERRKMFGDRKANSIEGTDIGHTIGAIGVQVLPPAVAPSALPDPLRTSEKIDDPPKLSKSTSGSRILDKIRGRSSSRGKLPRQATSVDAGSEQSSGQATPTTTTPIGSVTEFATKNRTSSAENVLPKGTATSYHPFKSTPSSSSFASSSVRSSRTSSSSAIRNISSSYSNVRSLSSRFLHRS